MPSSSIDASTAGATALYMASGQLPDTHRELGPDGGDFGLRYPARFFLQADCIAEGGAGGL